MAADGAAALAPALQLLTGLTRLDLASNRRSMNPIGPDGMAALAPALQQLTGLQQL